jgi:hypothetical protein
MKPFSDHYKNITAAYVPDMIAGTRLYQVATKYSPLYRFSRIARIRSDQS